MTAEQTNPFRPPEAGGPGMPVLRTATPPVLAAPWAKAYAGAPDSREWFPGRVLPEPRNGLGTASLIVGGLGIWLCWTFVLGPGALLLGLTAVLLGAFALRRVRRGQATNRHAALAGLWTGAGAGVVGAVLSGVLVFLFTWFVDVESAAGSDHLAEEGDQVRYADGLVVVFDLPEPTDGGGAVTVTARVANQGEDDLVLRGGNLTAYADGETITAGSVERDGPEPGRLAVGEEATVSWSVTVPPGTAYLGLDYAPGRAHLPGFWELALSGAPLFAEDIADV
ncbi:hypothetical protein PJ985_19115 [Streptomyces sp. ACA25]|uniref:hypothetical protein n=1 Tax=Streptomyces sp. ACA25 TaxID=3022596 RepID=UPI0023071E20|nr:hypothetical protein [Streptomyces sp. ACA25]MDB1089670.1 hypothetical protein [Streptomyces sp. ACA25]